MLKVPLAADQAIDSRDYMSTFLGESKSGAPFILEESNRALAVREGEWKLVQSNPRNQKRKAKNATPKTELFNLASDQGEQNKRLGN